MEINPSSNYWIEKVHYWLDYEISGSSLLLLSYIYPLAFLMALGAALLFTPLLLKVLIEERKIGWLISFLIFVVGPAVFASFYFENPTIDGIGKFVMIGNFYFYCAILRLVIPNWYHEE